jgi:mRNA-degrading endonuclease toxin of MazEF toxin-antitoxin module
VSFHRRGEVYLVTLDPTVGYEINKTAPAIVISNFPDPPHPEAFI